MANSGSKPEWLLYLQHYASACKHIKSDCCQPNIFTNRTNAEMFVRLKPRLTEPIPFLRPVDDSPLPSPFDMLLHWWMFAIWTRCPCAFIRPSAGRQIGRGSGTSISCLRAGDKTTVPCHHAGDKTRLLFTDHTSTLYHLTPGSSKACWVDDTPRKMDLSNLRSKHINYPGIGLSMCRGSWFQFSWDVACKILISRLHIYFAFISCYTGMQMEILNNICHISLNLVGIH